MVRQSTNSLRKSFGVTRPGAKNQARAGPRPSISVKRESTMSKRASALDKSEPRKSLFPGH